MNNSLCKTWTSDENVQIRTASCPDFMTIAGGEKIRKSPYQAEIDIYQVL
jgi:hypothetical protein